MKSELNGRKDGLVMVHSITWIQLCKNEYLVVCVNCVEEITSSIERELKLKGIKMQRERRVTCTEYIASEYRFWKNETITNEEKEMIESLITK